MRRKAAHTVMIALVDLFDHTTLFITKMADWIAPTSTPPEAMALIHGSLGLALSASAWMIIWHVSLLCARLIRFIMTLYIDFRAEAARRFDYFWASSWLKAVRKLSVWTKSELARLVVDSEAQSPVKKRNSKRAPASRKRKPQSRRIRDVEEDGE